MKPSIIILSVLFLILFTKCEKEDELLNAPPPCSNYAITYGGNNQVVIFGGGGNGTSDRTFEYDLISHNWIGYSPSPRPSHRYVNKMVYIGANRIIMFGGYDWKNFLNDIWEYNTGTHTWKEISVNSDEKPIGRYEHGMTFTDNGKIIIFGGSYTPSGGQEEYLNDTWEFDISTSTWIEHNKTGIKPPARKGHSMEYIGDNKIILFGGHDGGPTNVLWQYDISDYTWTNITESAINAPLPRYNFAMAKNIMNNNIIIFGGRGISNNFNDTWELDPLTFQWTEYNISEEKPSRRGFMDMCATTESKIILFGGGDGIENGTDKYLYNDLWEYDASIHIWKMYN